MTIHVARRIGGLACFAMVLAAIVAGTAFRLWHLATWPLWLDEAYSAYAADHGWWFLWHMVPRYETHPPLYYSLLHAWSLLTGTSLLARRLLGLVVGLATLPVAALAARRLGELACFSPARRNWLVASALLLTALQPLLIEMTRQVRPYPVMVLVYATGLLALFAIAADVRIGRPIRRGPVAGFFACEALMLWLHALGPLFAAAMTLALACLVVGRGIARRDWIALAAGQIAAGLIYLPAFLIILGEAPTWVATTWLRFRPALLPVELGSLYVDWSYWARWIGAGAGSLGLVLLVLRGREGLRLAGALALLCLLPTIASILLSYTVSPVFLDRTLSPVTIPSLLVVAFGLCWAGPWMLLGALPLALLAGSMLRLDRMLAHRPPPQRWYLAIRWLEPRMAPGDVIWAYPNEGALPLAYGLKDRKQAEPIVPIPAAVPALHEGGFFVTGSRGVVSLYPNQIAALMRTPGAQSPNTIWLLRLGPWMYDRGDRMLHALEQSRSPVAHFRSGAIDLIGLRRKDLPAVAPPQQPQP